MARKTISDVAAEAGVSIKTVSRVLNDEAGVRPDTRAKVKAVMEAMNYRPSLPARSLAGRRSNLIGLIYENPSANYVFDVQNGAMRKCRDANIRLFVQSCNDLGSKLIEEVLAMVEQTHVDGLIVTPPLSASRELIDALDRKGIRFVRMAPDDFVHPSPSVEMDDEAAAREIAQHLIALGHRRIGFIAGHPHHYSSKLRLEGYRSAMESAGIALDQVPFAQGYNDIGSGTEAGRLLLRRDDPPTAIFASNDDMAAGVLIAAHEIGMVVPDQLSVAGFDDSQLASVVWPSLTTIHQPTYDMAYSATELLIDMVRGKEVPAKTALAHQLVRRASTAAPL